MRTFSAIIFLLFIQFSFGQKAKDYFNKEVIDSQKKTARSIIKNLENGEIELSMKYFDNSISELKNTLKSISYKISKVKTETKFSLVIVFDEGFNIYRCRYYDEINELYQVDLFMSEGQPNSDVKKLETKNSEVLKAEQKRRMEMKDVPPPPPPH
ncbi:hypothetical protein [Aquimarina sp. Aq107]|uniref:hypothetical protein n=1 Tax=Aquimarina sp. Aq107 TaxID=1191912 RepID=UPI000D552A62|nr:hypothetical protein [Aquimarina sp. Aq107]